MRPLLVPASANAGICKSRRAVWPSLRVSLWEFSMSVKNGEARPHAHHRERLKERFLKQGVDSLAPHEALELLLFYAIPQRDTNLLAHHLLERFGSLQAVLQASIGDLCAMPGVSRHTATLLHLILPLAATALTVPAQEQRPTFYARPGAGISDPSFLRRAAGGSLSASVG